MVSVMDKVSSVFYLKISTSWNIGVRHEGVGANGNKFYAFLTLELDVGYWSALESDPLERAHKTS
jgi:hypothetical protein